MAVIKIVLIVSFIAVTSAQRPFYAGLSPIGYPETANTLSLSNRFGSDEPLPLESRGDVGLVNRIASMPQDKQLFWYLNRKQYDDLRRNPQNYPQRPNSFN